MFTDNLKLVESKLKSKKITSSEEDHETKIMPEEDHWQHFNDSIDEIEALEMLAEAKEELLKE